MVRMCTRTEDLKGHERVPSEKALNFIPFPHAYSSLTMTKSQLGGKYQSCLPSEAELI